MHMTLTTSQFTRVALNPAFADGDVAELDGVPKWETTGPIALEISADGMSAIVRALGEVGAAQVTATADVRKGPDVRMLVDVLDIDVIPREATTLGMTASAPEEQDVDPAPIEEPAPVDEAVPTEPTEPPPAE